MKAADDLTAQQAAADAKAKALEDDHPEIQEAKDRVKALEALEAPHADST